jgi:hypothetical protein
MSKEKIIDKINEVEEIDSKSIKTIGKSVNIDLNELYSFLVDNYDMDSFQLYTLDFKRFGDEINDLIGCAVSTKNKIVIINSTWKRIDQIKVLNYDEYID